MASVTVESGVHRKVSTTPSGCMAPKCASAIGVLTRNAESPEAMAREVNSPPIASQPDLVLRPSSRGIHASHRARSAGEMWRSASTQA